MFRVFVSLTQTLIPSIVLRQDNGGSNRKPKLRENRSAERNRTSSSCHEDELNRRRVHMHLAKMNELARSKERSAKS